MIYQLPSGRAIEISLEQYLDMSDEELDYLNSYGAGDSIEDPWFGSVLTKNGPAEIISTDDHYIEDLTTITNEEKLVDPDIDISSTDE